LVAPYLERRLEELLGAPVSLALERAAKEERPASSDAALHKALGKTKPIWRRPDGKPVTAEAESVSVAHTPQFTLAVAGTHGVACDLETVTARADTVWRWARTGSSWPSGWRTNNPKAWTRRRRACGPPRSA
jgi:hypothetical protein